MVFALSTLQEFGVSAAEHDLAQLSIRLQDPQAVPKLLGTRSLVAGQPSALDFRFEDEPPPPALTKGTGNDLRIVLPTSAARVRIDQGSPATATTWPPGDTPPLPAQAEATSGGLAWILESACGGAIRWTLGGDGWTTPLFGGSPPSCQSTVAAYPTAQLSGLLRTPVGEKRPTSAVMAAWSCPAAEGLHPEALGEFPVKVGKAGRWQAQIPSGCVDLALRASGFSALSWRGLRLETGEERDLGPATLTTGASLIGRVLALGDGRAEPDLEVSVVPAADLGAAAEQELAGRPWPGLQKARSDHDGWFSFSDLAAGRYALLVRQQKGVPAFSSPFELAAGEELVLEDFPVPTPAALRISASLQADLLPADTRLELEVQARFASCGWVDTPLTGSASVTEPLQLEGGPLPPGEWRVRVFVRPPGLAAYELRRQDLRLQPGEDAQVDLDLEGVLFTGSVTRGDEGASGELRLQPWDLGGAQAVAAGDEEGRFSVLLPERDAGLYRVRFQPESDSRVIVVPKVAFEDPAEEIRIELPSGAIRGMVVDEDGLPVADAVVRADAVDDSPEARDRQGLFPYRTSARSSAEGLFELEDLPEGSWALSARHGDLESDAADVELAEGERSQNHLLRLRRGRQLQGVLLSLGQPVANARGILEVATGPLPSPRVRLRHFRTAADGSFAVSIPQQAAGTVNLIVEARGYPVAAWRLPVKEGLELNLPPRGGQVRLLSRPAGRGEIPLLNRLVLVNSQGAMVAPPFVGRADDSAASEPDATAFLLPHLAPGSWRVVALDGATSSAEILIHGQAGQLPPLVSFHLGEGQSLEIDLRSSETAEGRQ